MTGLCGCFIRRTAGMVGVLVAVALIAAPVALANGGTTITAAADVQFKGVVDAGPQCAGRYGDPRSRGATGSPDLDRVLQLD